MSWKVSNIPSKVIIELISWPSYSLLSLDGLMILDIIMDGLYGDILATQENIIDSLSVSWNL